MCRVTPRQDFASRDLSGGEESETLPNTRPG